MIPFWMIKEASYRRQRNVVLNPHNFDGLLGPGAPSTDGARGLNLEENRFKI